MKCCGNRREAVCPSCAETYRGDAYQLVAAGLRGGKGVPESVTEHPTIFVTLTAPSFGRSTRGASGTARPQRCRPRRRAEVCPHGVRLSCGEVHAEDDPRLGEPLCAECFDYERAVIWNALAPELWRRTAIQIPRELARLSRCVAAELRRRVRVSYVKVAEYQRRGSLHFHCVIRLDRAQPRDTADLVSRRPAFSRRPAVRGGARRGRASVRPRSRARRDVDGRRGSGGGSSWRSRPLEAAAGEASKCAGYIAKYATKSTEVVGGLMYRLGASDLAGLRVRDHVRRYVECAWRLGGEPRPARPAAAAVGAHAGIPRALLHQEPALLDDLHRAAPRTPRARVASRAPRRRRDPWGRPVGDGASRERSRFRWSGSATARPATRGLPSAPRESARGAPGRA